MLDATVPMAQLLNAILRLECLSGADMNGEPGTFYMSVRLLCGVYLLPGVAGHTITASLRALELSRQSSKASAAFAVCCAV